MKNKINVIDSVELKERLETKKVYVEIGNFLEIMKKLEKEQSSQQRKESF